jgi:hypothetical protein
MHTSGVVVNDSTFVGSSFVGERLVLDETHEAEVFGPDHPIISGLIELEVDQLVELGDHEGEARAWLVDRTDAVWMALFAQGAPRVAEYVEGVIRLTGAKRSHRMIDDLAHLLGSDSDTVEAAIAQQFGVSKLAPFADLTTLDITPLGASTQDVRFANLFRLVAMTIFVGVRCVQLQNITRGVGLVHPRLLKHLPLLGFPVMDLGFGVLDYKLSEVTTTPMPTQAIGVDFIEALKELTSGSDFMKATGQLLIKNGYSI